MKLLFALLAFVLIVLAHEDKDYMFDQPKDTHAQSKSQAGR